jgi:hypothetical protein
MVGTWRSANARFNDPAAQVSAQWGVKLDGGIVRWVEEEFTSFSAGDWGWNLRCVAIEGEDGGDYNGPRTPELYASYGSLVREIAARHNIQRIVLGATVLGHRDVHPTACPDALDVAYIVWLANGGNDMTFDPRKYPADLAFLDQRIRDIVMGEPDVTAFALKKYLNAPHPLGIVAPGMVGGGSLSVVTMATGMRGTPPKGHPVRRTRTGTTTARQKAARAR